MTKTQHRVRRLTIVVAEDGQGYTAEAFINPHRTIDTVHEGMVVDYGPTWDDVLTKVTAAVEVWTHVGTKESANV